MAPRTTDARSRCRSNPHLVRRPYPPARFAHSCRGLSQRRPTTHISCLLVGVAPAAARACSVRWMLSTLFACRKIRKCDICVRKKQIPPGDRLAAPTRRSIAGMSRLPRSNHRSKLVANKVAEDNRAIALFVVRSLDITTSLAKGHLRSRVSQRYGYARRQGGRRMPMPMRCSLLALRLSASFNMIQQRNSAK